VAGQHDLGAVRGQQNAVDVEEQVHGGFVGIGWGISGANGPSLADGPGGPVAGDMTPKAEAWRP
jgi:hypothetical protein